MASQTTSDFSSSESVRGFGESLTSLRRQPLRDLLEEEDISLSIHERVRQWRENRSAQEKDGAAKRESSKDSSELSPSKGWREGNKENSVGLSPAAHSYLLKTLHSPSKLGPPKRTPVTPDGRPIKSQNKASSKKGGETWSVSGTVRRRPRSKSTSRKRNSKLKTNRKLRSSSLSTTRSKRTEAINERPAWDGSIHDLNVYRLSPEQIQKNHIRSTSRHDRRAKSRLEREGISAEQQEEVLNKILSPMWLIKRENKMEQFQEREDEEFSGNDSDTPSGDFSPGKSDKRSWFNATALGRLAEQIEQFEKVTGRGTHLGPLDLPIGSVPEKELPLKLFKLCTRLVNHLASVEQERIVCEAKERTTQEEVARLSTELEKARLDNETLRDRSQALEKELSQTLLGAPLRKFSPPTESVSRGPDLVDEQADSVRNKISKRYKLMAKWRAESQEQNL